MKIAPSKQQVLDQLSRQLNLVDEIKRQRRFSPEFKKWQRDTRVAIDYAFAGEAQHLRDFDMIGYSGLAVDASESFYDRAFSQGMDDAAAILRSYIDEVQCYWVDLAEGGDKNILGVVEHFCDRFHYVVRQLRVRRMERPTLEIEDEYDVQYLLHALLRLEFEDVRPEEWTPSYAGGCSRMDFLLKQEQLVIETKKTRQGFGTKELGDQLIIDIERYQVHPDCRTLVCFVYDPEGRLANPKGLENDLNRGGDGFLVRVIITPK